ncbi:MAG TPA: SMP-30/gluconolactonase/LRE family protein [Burkholderiales bacterium]|nr:SMP-30/gluconolactonase/LRE family protein [Burkholderiales bacterium]
MSKKVFAVLLSAFATATAAEAPVPKDASFTTLITTPLAIEGLTADRDGNLYTTGRAATGTPCPVWRINIASPSLVVVGTIPNPAACNPSGIAFDALGNLYIADASGAGQIWTLTPNVSTPPLATAFATDVPGTNGLAFDRDGNLWTGDGTTGMGRVWKIPSGGAKCLPPGSSTPVNCVEAFRVQPMRNGADLGGDIAGRGVGRENRTVPVENAQNLVANGVAFDHEGNLYVADTARGAVWQVGFDRQGNVKNAMNCDTTFTNNTLCLDSVFVAHPYLEGTDGIALDSAGNIWNSANERNAIVVVSKQGNVSEVFRNPANADGLRNSADATVGNNHILEFPTSPVLLGKTFCTANSDGNRRDNSPNTAGEVNQGGAGARGKISCMDQDLIIPGMPLPVR